MEEDFSASPDEPKPKAKKAAKRKSAKAKKKRPAKSKTKRPAPKAKKAAKRKPAKAKSVFIARPERLDMRLTKAEKAKINAKAKELRRTVTSIVLEAIEKIG